MKWYGKYWYLILTATLIILGVAAYLIYRFVYMTGQATDNANAYSSSDANMNGFMQMVRKGEGTLGDSGYTIIFGGSHFTSFADHPRQLITAGGYSSDAAGAYQFLSKTWDFIQGYLNLPDFSPASQDKAFVWYVTYLGAYNNIEAGNISAAINETNKTWASLPGSPYGQPVQTLAGALAYYQNSGGNLIS